MNQGFILWFTGLSGAGKSTLARMIEERLLERGVPVEVLDGDEVRAHLSSRLGFSKEDRDLNIRRIGFVARLLARNGACAITAAISPYKAIRQEIRKSVEGEAAFAQVFVECPLEELKRRDPKGLYKKALSGEIRNFTGISDPYEPPDESEVIVHTKDETPEQSCSKILLTLEKMGLIPPMPGEDYGDDEEAEVAKRLQDLGYLG